MADLRMAFFLTIRGTVQGVGFRRAMARRARELHVGGWVRNRPDGTVEALIEGSPEAVRAILAWCRQGPPFAFVTTVDAVNAAAEGQDHFIIRP